MVSNFTRFTLNFVCSSELNRKTSFANKLQLLQKWRADDELIRLGIAITKIMEKFCEKNKVFDMLFSSKIFQFLD